MLREKINLDTIFYLLNIVAFVMYYIVTDIRFIDIVYLVLILFLIVKEIYFELFS